MITAAITAEKFFELEREIIESGMGSDKDSFEVIRERLISPPIMTPEEFAREAVYVILAGGFRQVVAKRKYSEIVPRLYDGVTADEVFAMFHNPNKAKAIAMHWNERARFCSGFYARPTAERRIAYLSTLPHIGQITAHHLARNLGISVVKYDVWIQRLGIMDAGLSDTAAAFPLEPRVQAACDAMFGRLEAQTGLPRGYIDVVLWKACQIKLIELS